MSKPAALILAGTRPGGDPFAREQGVSHKGLIEVGGQPIMTRVIIALKKAGLAPIAVSTDNPALVALARTMDCVILPTGAGPSASVAIAFAELGAPLLVTTSDHALLEGRWVEAFLADAPTCDVALMLAHRDLVEAAVPGSRRTWLKFRDGGWSGCNLFLLSRDGAASAIAAWSGIEANRKQPWKIAFKLGPIMLLRFLLGRLTAHEAISAVGRKLGIEAALVPARDGLAAVDVDKAEDLDLAREIVERRGF